MKYILQLHSRLVTSQTTNIPPVFLKLALFNSQHHNLKKITVLTTTHHFGSSPSHLDRKPQVPSLMITTFDKKSEAGWRVVTRYNLELFPSPPSHLRSAGCHLSVTEGRRLPCYPGIISCFSCVLRGEKITLKERWRIHSLGECVPKLFVLVSIDSLPADWHIWVKGGVCINKTF